VRYLLSKQLLVCDIRDELLDPVCGHICAGRWEYELCYIKKDVANAQFQSP
jgi:hypothetical protein